MLTVTLYWSDTGKIEKCLTVAHSGLLSIYTEQGMEWVQIPSDADLHWMPSGVRTDRPKLAPDADEAPFDIDCSVTGGEVLFRNEPPASEEATETGVMTLTDPGEYEIEPPFPWQKQTLVLT